MLVNVRAKTATDRKNNATICKIMEQTLYDICQNYIIAYKEFQPN